MAVCGPRYFGRYSDLLWAGRSTDRIPVWARFSAPVQTDRETQPTTYTRGAQSLVGVKRPGCDVLNPTPSSDEVKDGVEPDLYFPSGPLWPVVG